MKRVLDDDDDYGVGGLEGYLECDHHVILQRLSDGIVPANIRGLRWFQFFVVLELDGKRGEKRSHLSKEMQHK